MVEYCDTPHIEREEKQGTQSIPKEGSYGVYSTGTKGTRGTEYPERRLELPLSASIILPQRL